MSLLGRSGSGKTQLLELIAGLNTPDSGEIWINGADVTKMKIYERNAGLVFQDYAIFPNMTVSGNIAYSLHSRRMSRKEIIPRVRKIAEDLEHHTYSRPFYFQSFRGRTSACCPGQDPCHGARPPAPR